MNIARIRERPLGRSASKIRPERTPPTPAAFARMAGITPHLVLTMIRRGVLVLRHGPDGRPALYAPRSWRAAG